MFPSSEMTRKNIQQVSQKSISMLYKNTLTDALSVHLESKYQCSIKTRSRCSIAICFVLCSLTTIEMSGLVCIDRLNRIWRPAICTNIFVWLILRSSVYLLYHSAHTADLQIRFSRSIVVTVWTLHRKSSICCSYGMTVVYYYKDKRCVDKDSHFGMSHYRLVSLPAAYFVLDSWLISEVLFFL